MTVTPSAPGTDSDDPDIPVQGEDFPPTMPHDVLQVDESALDGGSGGGSATADGSMSVSAPDGVATITIGGVVVWQNGALTGNPVQTDEGHLDVTGFDGTNLTYTYTLDKATQEHGKEGGGENDAIAHEMEVVVTDSDGDSGSAVIRVEITDDVPVLEVQDTIETVESGVTESSATGKITFDFGADDTEGKSFTVSVEGKDVSTPFNENDSTTVVGKYGTLTINVDGTYSYTANTNTEIATTLGSAFSENVTDKFTFTITDADGDTVSKTLDVTVSPAEAPTFSGTVTVDEAGLASGTDASSNQEYATIDISAFGDSFAAIVENRYEGTYGQIFKDTDGTWKYQLMESVQPGPQNDGPDNNNATDSVTIEVLDKNGNTHEVVVNVTILDDAPEITVTAGNPERGEQTNLTDGTLTSFENYDDSIWHAIEDEHSATICNGQVTMTAGIIHNGQPDTFVDDPYATFDKGFENHSNLEDLSHGLTVNGGIQDYPSPGTGSTDEIAADAHHSEAVQFTLNGLAYGLNLQLGAFFSAGADDPANEIVRVIFYRGDNIVEDITLDSTSVDGVFGKKGEFSQYFAEGFDRVVITAVDNGNIENNSEFVISNIGFVTQPNAMYVTSGTVTAVSGADGFDHAFDGNPHTEFAQADGTAYEDGQPLTLYDAQGESFTVTLEIKEGTSGGDKVMTAYRTENGAADSSQPVFSVNLDQDGNWTFKQYETFHDSPQSNDNTFELGFVTKDADGDRAFDSESIHLNTGTYGAVAGTADNSGDTIVITGGDGVAGTVAAGDSGGVDVITNVQPGQDYNISIMLDLSGSMNDPSGSAGMSRLDMAKEALTTFINDTLAKHDGEINLQLITFNKTATVEDTWVLKSGTTEEIKNYNQAEIAKIVKTLDQIGKGVEGTNYEAAMEKATEWFSKDTAEGGVAGNGGENLAFFISDGQPTYYQGTTWWGRPSVAGNGEYSDQATVQATLEAAQGLQNAGGSVKVNAIGIGTNESLHEKAQTILDLIDNTGGSGQTVTEYPYQYNAGTPFWPQYDWTTADCTEGQELVLGDSDLVDSENDLTAALVGGSIITSTELADAGDDTVDASDSTSSAIIYGDVMNTDRLLYELKQNKAITQMVTTSVIAALPDYGSGTQVFQWLEDNDDKLTGTKFEGWTHDDSVKYMLQHAEELGYETRVDADGDFYLVKADGTVLNMDGSEAGIDLDSLTGRDGGDDVITGSSASDTIYGQEGHDTIYGGGGHDGLYGGTGNDLLVGDARPESLTADTLEEIKTLGTGDALDAFIDSVEGTDADGNDQLFGGAGNDVLLGMGGDDYLDGGAGEDATFGGGGNDIIVYDKADYLVSGGSGIDFMVSTDSQLTMKALLEGTGDGNGPIVDGIEVLLKGNAALSLTSIQELADKYGITLGTNPDGQETLTLDMGKWTEQADGSYDFHGGAEEGGLTLETNLQHDSDASSDNGEMAQQVFILEHTNS